MEETMLRKHLLNILSIAFFAGTTVYGSVEAMKNTQFPQKGKEAVLSFGGEGGRDFILDGKPFQIRSGEMHPQRIPRSHWRHRIRAAKAMGLNTIAFYTFWNDLEPEEGKWDFSGRKDIGAFIDMCQEEGMWVLFRPGPYVCGEWDLGGLPTYLIQKDVSPLRCTTNPEFMEAQTRYLEEMAKIAIPRLSKNGGPILMIQLENEYGSYNSPHDEKAYIEWLRDFWSQKGAGPFYLSEGSSPHHLRFVIPGVAVGLDPADHAGQMQHALRLAPGVPVFSSETYPGWLRHWGEGNWAPSRNTLNSVRWYMKDGISFNLFVLHGGTSFGLTAGANSNGDGTHFQPDLTSYDYGSPIGEHGNLTREYHEYRDIITKALPGVNIPPPPATPECISIPAFTPKKKCTIFQLRTRRSREKAYTQLPTLESQGQNQGLAIYTATIPAGKAQPLHATAHDHALVYLDDTFLGSLDRMAGTKQINIPARTGKKRLRIVVDTFGHVNFSRYTEQDRKGLLGEVKLGDTLLTDWRMRLLPLQREPRQGKKNQAKGLGGLYQASLHLNLVADTFLDMSQWQKGYVWVNGHALGRYWNIGPQERLYCPGQFLRQGDNTITVLDLYAEQAAPITGEPERNLEIKKHTKSLNNNW